MEKEQLRREGTGDDVQGPSQEEDALLRVWQSTQGNYCAASKAQGGVLA